MPLYEYQCESCQHRFEKIRKFSDPPLETCPVCNGAVRKLLSSPAFQFKGTGFYITDYPKKSSKDASQSDGAQEKSETGKSEKSNAGNSDKASTSDSGTKTTESPAATKTETKTE